MSEFTVIAKPHPFRTSTVQAMIPVGARISDVLGDVRDDNVSVAIEGEYIPREMWDRIRPKAGTQISVARTPRGRTVRKIVVIVLLVLIYVYAPYLAPYLQTLGMSATMASVVAGIITLAAVMAVTALIPPPELPKMSSDSSASDFNRLNSITGTSNQATPYGSIPMVIGQCRYYPPFAANPYTEISGDKQYLRMLLDLGYGDLVISDIKIGETDIDDFEGVEYEISTAPTMFTDDIFEASLADAFNSGADVTKTTQTLTDEISVDIIFPQGLFAVDKNNKTLKATTSVTLSYRAVGATPWINVATTATGVSTSSSACFKSGSTFQITSSEKKLLRMGIRWTVPQGQYEVRLQRGSTSYAGTTAASFDTAQLTALRSIKHTNPSKTGTLKLALRIQATDQLNGVINQLSVLGQQKIKTYNTTTHAWDAPSTNYNPAWVYYWLLTACPGMAKLVGEDRMDLQAFIDWAADCTSKSFTSQGMLDKAISAGELFKMVLASGRAAFAMRDGLYSVIYDRDTLVPVQHFTPANSSNFSGQRVFIDMPHAIRAQFQNPALNWQQDEIIVLADGYSFNGLGPRGNPSGQPAATKFETMAFPYCTDPIQVWQLARYQMAQGIYRPNVYNWKADAENLVCTRGDLVYMNHDVTDWGNGFGLVSSTHITGSTVDKLNLAEPFFPVSGKTMTVRVRTKDAVTHLSNISAWSNGNSTDGYLTITLATPMPTTVDTGDLYMIGTTAQATTKLLITRIEPGEDLTASLTAVEYSADCQAYDDSPPSSFISQISGTLILEPPPPPKISSITSQPLMQPGGGGLGGDGGGGGGQVDMGLGPGYSGYFNVFPPMKSWAVKDNAV